MNNFHFYLFVCPIAQVYLSCYESLPTNRPWDAHLTLKSRQKSLISKLYEQLMDFDGHPVRETGTAWEQELGLGFTDQWRYEAVYTIHSNAACARLQLSQFQV